ncbi:recombinase family protein [Glycomyces sp. NRRL B-16210]|uniref:recombinase family protein n=1 Tax=Glycomyces sp. NRRL B-16210 TaxID=1463821 RepID=UPI00350FD36D
MLEVDQTRAAVVRRIFELRIGRSAGYEAIAEILNQDLALNPPPEPSNPARARGSWCGGTVREILRNPKYTGYMVWNRHATKRGGNRINPINEWVWSPEPTHEAIISPEEFSAAQQVSGHRARRRGKSAEQRRPTDYRLRSTIRCALCGLRMYGTSRKERIYYSCHPKRGSRPEGHPAATYLREDLAEGVIARFLDSFLLGAQRTGRLRALADQLQEVDAAELEQERATLAAALAESEQRKSKLVRVFELTEEFDTDLIQSVVERQRQLSRECQQLRVRIETIDDALRSRPDVRIVDAFPCNTIDTDRLPGEMFRRLLQAFRVELVYEPERRELTCNATITPTLVQVVQKLINEVANAQKDEKPARALSAVRVSDVARVGFEPTLYGF